MIISFEASDTGNGATMGRWIVNNNGLQLAARQLGSKVTIDLEGEQKVTLMGAIFTYQSDNKRNSGVDIGGVRKKCGQFQKALIQQTGCNFF